MEDNWRPFYSFHCCWKNKQFEVIFDSFEFKRLKYIKNDELSEGDQFKIVDFSDLPPLEGDEEEVKSEPENTVTEIGELNPRKTK